MADNTIARRYFERAVVAEARVKTLEEALRLAEIELNAHGLSHHMGEEECAAGYALGLVRAVVSSAPTATEERP
jgi:hypothetical protein